MTLEAIQWKSGKLKILDQLLLPHKSEYVEIKNVSDGWNAISKMQVRGAPAIAIVGCLSLAVDITNKVFNSKSELNNYVKSMLDDLVKARPTAVNMERAAKELKHLGDILEKDETLTTETMKDRLVKTIEEMLDKDISDNKAIGEFGADEILRNGKTKNLKILTHCNTGSLATAGYGTALGIIRSLFNKNCIERVYCTETRPYNQGGRLTAYELVYEKIPSTLICDNMVGALMKSNEIAAVVVGADRVAANGDTANKIGTYQLAILAKYHKVPFYVAAPRTSIDLTIPSGSNIKIEQRPEIEMTHLNGSRIAAPGIECWNPAFDITPAELIDGIVTEIGVFKPSDLYKIKQ